MEGQKSPGGVFIAKNFRDNLIIDRHDPVFDGMRAGKINHLRSANSEDAVTWNVFRTLRQISPSAWLAPLWTAAFDSIPLPTDHDATIDLWVSTPPPPKLLDSGAEHASEVDVVIQSPSWVWFIEAKYRSDISMRTTTRSGRDQVLRNIDVGSFFAGARDFYFSLLVTSREQSPEGASVVDAYKSLNEPRRLLVAHRPDGLRNLRAVSLITWSSLAGVLAKSAVSAARTDEQGYGARALAWLATRGIAPAAADGQRGVASQPGPGQTPTTQIGFVNRNEQRVVRPTGFAGTDHLQYVYVLRCERCGAEYGATGSDIHARKCPACQGGAPGLPF